MFEKSLAALALTAFVAGPLPAQAALEPAPSSRWIRADDCLFQLEIVSRKELLAKRPALPILDILCQEKTQGFLAWLSAHDRAWGQIWKKRQQWLAFMDRFEAGWTASSVFASGPAALQRGPRLFLIAAASAAPVLRGMNEAFGELLAGDSTLVSKPLTLRKIMAAESPSFVNVHELPASDTWRRSREMLSVQKGRLAGFYGMRRFFSEDVVAQTLAGLVGLGAAERSGQGAVSLLERPVERLAGESALGSFVLRFQEHITHPKHGILTRGEKSVVRVLKTTGLWGWQGLRTTLLVQQDAKGLRAREILDSSSEQVTQLSPFRFLRGDAYGLGDAASFLPEDALAAGRVAFDAEQLSAWALAVADMNGVRREAQAFFESLRVNLELLPSKGDKGVQGLTELVFALLPGVPSSILPEPCLLLRLEGDPRQPVRVVDQLSRTLRERMQELGMPASRYEMLQSKTLGRAPDAISYLPLKALIAGPPGPMLGGLNELLLSRGLFAGLSGGGYLAAARVGPYLVLGCNPRTVRKLVRAARKGATLARRAGFLERFPKASKRPIEAYFDWKRLLQRAKFFDNLAAMAMAFQPRPKSQQKPQQKKTEQAPALVIPKTSDIAKLLGEEFISVEETAYGHRMLFEGSLVISPFSWVATGVVAAIYDDIAGLLGR